MVLPGWQWSWLPGSELEGSLAHRTQSASPEEGEEQVNLKVLVIIRPLAQCSTYPFYAVLQAQLTPHSLLLLEQFLQRLCQGGRGCDLQV